MTACDPHCPVVKEQLRKLVDESPWLQEKYGRKPGGRAPLSTPATSTFQEVATSTPETSVLGSKSPSHIPDGEREDPEGQELKNEDRGKKKDLKEGLRVKSEKESYIDSQHLSDQLSDSDEDTEADFERLPQGKPETHYADENKSRLRPGEFKREPFVKYPKKQRSYDNNEFNTAERRKPVKGATSVDEEELKSQEDFELESWEDSLIPGDQSFDPIAKSTPKEKIKASRNPQVIRRTSSSEEEKDFYKGKDSFRMEKSGSAELEAGPSKGRTGPGKTEPPEKPYKPNGKGRKSPKRGDTVRESQLCELEDECDFDNVCVCRMHCVIRGLRKYSFVRNMLTAVVLFTIGLKLCAELDSWNIQTRVE